MSSGAQRKAPEPDAAAAVAAAAASAREQRRARRHRRPALRDRYRGYEFMDLDSDIGPDSFADPATLATSTASGLGAGGLGFAATAPKNTAAASGLTTLADDEFGNGPSAPMVPGTWDPGPGDPGELC